MGLLEELAGKSFDEATSVYRGRRARREAARDLLVFELRSYSEKIETMRIALIGLVEALRRPEVAVQVGLAARSALDAVSRDGTRPDRALDDACDELLSALPLDQAEWAAVQVFLQGEIYRQLLGPTNFEVRALAERSQKERQDLDLAWARVRPLLDDMVEVRVVLALRAHRHDLRSRLDYVMTQFARLEHLRAGSNPSPGDVAAAKGTLVEEVTDVIRFADAWNSMIGKVRGDVGRLRRA